MLVDIVQLPRRLKDFKRNASISSVIALSYPMTYLAREYGYWEPNDNDFLCLGGTHRLILGKDALFRYKFIEPTKTGIAEYFVLTSSPIDIMHPIGNKRTRLFCPWVTMTDPQTLRVRKFIIWNGVFELMHYETEDSVDDVPIEAVIANEIRNQAILHNRPDITTGLENYPKDWKHVLISEEKFDDTSAVDNLLTLGANIQAYNNITVNEAMYYQPDLLDIFRGVNLPTTWADTTPLQHCTFLSHVLHGSTTIGDIRHLFGMHYDTHAFQKFFNTHELDPYTEISIHSNSNPDLFGVLKLVEKVPFSEFAIRINETEVTPIVYNQYDPHVGVDQTKVKIAPELISKIVTELKQYCSALKKAEIVRSWGEEIFITIQKQDDTVEKYYFDLISAAIGNRALIRDYCGQMF